VQPELGTVDELARRVGGTVAGDGSVPISGIASVDEAGPNALTFATDERYLTAALAGRAAAVLVDASIPLQESAKPLIVVENARHALAKLLAALRPQRPQGPFRHPTAVVEEGATIEDGVYLGAHSYVGRGARIGRDSVLGAGAYVGDEAAVGVACWLHPHASLMERCVIGNRVVLHAGSVIGSEGFGWAFIEGRLERIPQVGNVVLDDDVEIGANTCVDRAQTGSTTIGRGTKIDNLVQIGHNCRIGKHSAFAAMVGLAGSTIVGDYVMVGGQSAFKGHVTVGSRVRIAGNTMIWGDVPDGASVSGAPAQNHRDELRQQVWLRNLGKLYERVNALERK